METPQRPAQETSATAIHESNTSAVSGFFATRLRMQFNCFMTNLRRKKNDFHWFSRQLLTCCFPKKRPLGFLVETLLATAALILHPHPFNMGISFVFTYNGLPGPHRRCHPRTRHLTAHRAHTAHIPASSWSLGLPDRSNDHNFRMASAASSRNQGKKNGQVNGSVDVRWGKNDAIQYVYMSIVYKYIYIYVLNWLNLWYTITWRQS